MEELKKLWQEYESTPFPANHRSKSFDGMTLTGLESELGSFILTYLNTGGQLGRRQYQTLKKRCEFLASIISQLDTKEAKSYFSSLKEMSQLIVEALKDSGLDDEGM